MRGIRLYPPGSRKGNRTYVARISAEGGRTEVALDTADRRVAERRAKELAQRYRGQPGTEAGRPRTFAQVADHYLAAKGHPPRTAAFLEKLRADDLGRMQAGSIASGDIQAAAHRLYPGTGNATKNRAAIVPAAAVLHYAADQGWCGYLKVRKLEEAQAPTRRPAEGTPELLMEHAEGALKVLLTLLFLQGWRLGEALDLTPKPDRVSLARRELLAWVGKAGRWKAIPMHPRVFVALANYLPTRAKARKLFPWSTRWGVYRELGKLRATLAEKGHAVDFTPHMARHWFGSELGDRKVPDRDIMDAGTWTSPKSVERYNKARHARARETLTTLDFGGDSGESARKRKRIKGG